MADDIFSCIEQKLPSLSKGQKAIAAYILSSCDKAAFLTASALGKTVKVSESTVVRFASLIGFDGYPELQKALQETVLSRLNTKPGHDAEENRISTQDLLSTVLREDTGRLCKTAEALDRAAFSGAVDALLNARRVYIHGASASVAPAMFLHNFLQYILEDVRLLTAASEGELCKQLLRVSPQDTLISVAFPHNNAAALCGLSHCRNCGAKTIVLTDCAVSAPALEADYILCASSDSVSGIPSMAAPMSVINALLVALMQRRKSETEQTLALLKELQGRYSAYEK